MFHFYLDASALGKRYAPETGTLLVNHLFSRATPNRFLVLNVGLAEVVAILSRKRHSGLLPASLYAQALTDFGAEMITSVVVKLVVDNAVVISALSLIDTHALNATDAIILRTALDRATVLRAVGDELALVTSDHRLVRAARAEGLTTFDPETQSQADLDALLGP